MRQILLLLLVTCPLAVAAQFVDLGQDPASVRWRQINAPAFRLVYPDFFEERAREIARLYTRLYAHDNSLGARAGYISMIIRANGGISNGNAGWAPKKSELYATPPQDANARWLEHLCVHEFRHVVQYDKINQGLSRALYRVLGEQYTMALVGLFVPMWLLEGDAVVFETAATSGGRGRSPEFLNAVKARVVEKGADAYRRAVLGSAREIIPDRYALGYFMVGNGRIHYGARLWQRVFERVGRRPHELFPVSLALRDVAGARRDSLWNDLSFRSLFDNPDSLKRANEGWNSIITLYRDNFSELRQYWKREAAAIEHLFDTIATGSRGDAVHYHSPVAAGNGRVLAYKEGPGEAGAIVELHAGRERVVTRVGMMTDPSIAYRDGVLVWSEYKPHPRWEHGGKMTLVTRNAITGERRRYPAAENRFAPFAARFDGKPAWGFVEVDRANRAAIVIADSTFRELARYNAREDELFVHPSFEGEDAILAVSLSAAGQQVIRVDTRSGARQELAPPSPWEIDRPVATPAGVIYRSARGGNNAIYRGTDLLVEARFGARYPSLSPGGDTLYFSFYTADGYRPALVPLSRVVPRVAPRVANPFPLADALSRDEGWDFSPPVDTSAYNGKPYNKALHAVNVHSWGPFFPDRDNMTVYPGLAVSSQDHLSTFYWSAGYVWDDGYADGNWKVNATYRGLWPTFKVNVREGRTSATVEQRAAARTGQVDTIRFTDRAREARFTASVEFPVNFSGGGRSRYVAPRALFSLRGAYRRETGDLRVLDNGAWREGNAGNYRLERENYWSRVMQYEVVFYNLARTSTRDLYPRTGERLEVGVARAFSGGTSNASTWWASGNLYLPGVARYHSVALYAGYQQKSDPARIPGNQVLSPRGTFLSDDHLVSARLSYYLPLAYPDCSLTPLLYVRRISGGVFIDAAATIKAERVISPGDGAISIASPRVTRGYRSYGVEVSSDTRLLDLTFPVTAGFRAGYETRSRSLFFNLLLSVGLSI
ncbi:MAG: hypothetical protein LBD64_08460 [Odoribacteraceae bacterium]|jgi:hypothetical protein|nr:hypothetical protein [Odoribacteraceae bacterium]